MGPKIMDLRGYLAKYHVVSAGKLDEESNYDFLEKRKSAPEKLELTTGSTSLQVSSA